MDDLLSPSPPPPSGFPGFCERHAEKLLFSSPLFVCVWFGVSCACSCVALWAAPRREAERVGQRGRGGASPDLHTPHIHAHIPHQAPRTIPATHTLTHDSRGAVHGAARTPGLLSQFPPQRLRDSGDPDTTLSDPGPKRSPGPEAAVSSGRGF